MRVIVMPLVVFFLAMVPAANAAIIWDYSPATTGAAVTNNGYSNATTSQNFAERFSFAGNATLTGMDIYMMTIRGNVGEIGTIRLWSDVSGLPNSLLTSFTESVSIVDLTGATAGNHRVHVDFSSPILLTGGASYWIGLSGTSTAWTQTGLAAVDDSRMASFTGPAFSFMTNSSVGDMAFRLEGTTTVPEPASVLVWSALAGTSAAVFVARRRRRLAPRSRWTDENRAAIVTVIERPITDNCDQP